LGREGEESASWNAWYSRKMNILGENAFSSGFGEEEGKKKISDHFTQRAASLRKKGEKKKRGSSHAARRWLGEKRIRCERRGKRKIGGGTRGGVRQEERTISLGKGGGRGIADEKDWTKGEGKKRGVNNRCIHDGNAWRGKNPNPIGEENG